MTFTTDRGNKDRYREVQKLGAKCPFCVGHCDFCPPNRRRGGRVAKHGAQKPKCKRRGGLR